MKGKKSLTSWEVISLDNAMLYTEKWQKKEQAIKAFTFHPNEISCIQNESNGLIESIRFYMGINDENELDMIAVGVDANGVDIIDEQSATSHIYNFAMPCPSTCDTKSPLYHGESITSAAVNFVQFPEGVTCIERLQEISFESAFEWTKKWQEQYDFYSFLFGIKQLEVAMKTTPEEAVSVRIYFGLDEDDEVVTVMIGVDEEGRDIERPVLQMNKVSFCGKANPLSTACDQSSPLYHNE